MNDSKTEKLSTDNDDAFAAVPAPRRNASSPAAGYLAVGLAVAAGLIRLLPHPANFTPLAGLGLFGGARLRVWQAVSLPLLVMVITDFVLWWVKGWSPFDPWVYGCFTVTVLLGLFLRRTKSWLRIGTASVTASVLFFMVTNFGVWLASRVDPQTLPAGTYDVVEMENSKYAIGTIRYADNERGLLKCYLNGLYTAKKAPPFGFGGNGLAGDLIFTALLFGAYAWLNSRVAKPQAAKAATAHS